MGLFHYLWIVKTDDSFSVEEREKFFCEQEFLITEKSNGYVALARDSSWGKIEVLIDKNKEISIRTKI